MAKKHTIERDQSSANATRRLLVLAGAASAALLTPMARAAATELSNPDQALIDLYARFARLHAEAEAIYDRREPKAEAYRVATWKADPALIAAKQDAWYFGYQNCPKPGAEWTMGHLERVNFAEDGYISMMGPRSLAEREDRYRTLRSLLQDQQQRRKVAYAAYGLSESDHESEENWRQRVAVIEAIFAAPAQTVEGWAIKAKLALSGMRDDDLAHTDVAFDDAEDITLWPVGKLLLQLAAQSPLPRINMFAC